MNLELLGKYSQHYPDIFECSLDCTSLPTAAAFNKYGSILSVGCNDGTIIIWDFMTRGIIKTMPCHVHPVTSIMWSRFDQQILTSSTDKHVSIWDPETNERTNTFAFSNVVMKAEYNPRNDNQILVTVFKGTPLIVEVGGKCQPLPNVDENDYSLVVKYDRKGEHVVVGNSIGVIVILNSIDFTLVVNFQINGSWAVTEIEFPKRGSNFLINTSDRSLRIYDMHEVLACGLIDYPSYKQRLLDNINRTTLKKCCFSGDGEYICSGSVRQNTFHIWDSNYGAIVKILQAKHAGDYILDVIWHPTRPIIVSLSPGFINIWTPSSSRDNWPAYYPKFVELVTNVEHGECESEFDMDDEDRSIDKETDVSDDNVEIDVDTVEPIPLFSNSDEEDYGSYDALNVLSVDVL